MPLPQKYLYAFVIGQYVKVGITTEPKTRFAQCVTGHNVRRPKDAAGDCDAVLMVRATLDAEQAVHLLLAPLGVGHEWYPHEGIVADWVAALRRTRFYSRARAAVGLPRLLPSGTHWPDDQPKFRTVSHVAQRNTT